MSTPSPETRAQRALQTRAQRALQTRAQRALQTGGQSALPVVHLRGLRKAFGKRLALGGIDLDLEGGQIVGVVGPDGAGKTTLIRSLAGLLEIEAREARVLGFDLRGDVTELKRHTGYVPQAFSLHRDLSVRENLRFTARLHRLPEEDFGQRSRELLERTGLAPFAERAAGALSGGMKQKLAVSNALLIRPPLLLLDEPTAGVDVVARGEIWALLERERPRTLVLISTSYLDEAGRCDRLLYLDDGRVVASGTPAELRARVDLELYRLWSDDPPEAARRAGELAWVGEARAGALFARVEVPRGRSPGSDAALRQLGGLGGVRLAEQLPVDMEATLLALARDHGEREDAGAARRAPRSGALQGHATDPTASGSAATPTANRTPSEGVAPRRPAPQSGAGQHPSSSGTDERTTSSIITARGLTKKFGDFTAVDRLDIHVAPGTIFAFLGANGSGKSTTIRMLIGLLQPTEGSVEVDGIDVIHHPRRVRDHIGYMGQKVSLYQGLSLRENVEFYAGLYGLSGADLERNWGALRERFSLAEVEREMSQDLPAGIRQRAGLALATLHHPRVLFLDEPTAGVDIHNRNLFWELIREEARAGVTVFVTTHFLEEVDYCDWVSFIDQGRLIANAEPEELRRRYSDGYRITLTAANEAAVSRGLDEAQVALGRLGFSLDRRGDELVFTTAALGSGLLAELARLSGSADGVRLRLEQPEMTEVFRRILTESATGAGTREAA